VDVSIGDVHPMEMRIRKGSLTESVLDGVKRGVKGTQRRRRRSR
jgi:hypothetical protein